VQAKVTSASRRREELHRLLGQATALAAASGVPSSAVCKTPAQAQVATCRMVTQAMVSAGPWNVGGSCLN
jgi:hypothetical protein